MPGGMSGMPGANEAANAFGQGAQQMQGMAQGGTCTLLFIKYLEPKC